jgi:nucleoside-diphosphate-sugar epimerase
MRVFVAGAIGAIGRPLVAELVRRGHAVTGMTRSDAGAAALSSLGAAVARVSAFDAPGLERALRESKAEVVIDELTALPKSPADMAAAAEGDRRLRLEGGGHLLAAARRCGVRRYVQQASGFFLRPGPGLGDESEGLAVDASPRVAAAARTYAELEVRLLGAADVEGVSCGTGSTTARAPGTTRPGRPPTW